MAQDAELKLKVSLDLAFFRQQLSTIGTQLAGQGIDLSAKIDQDDVIEQYKTLARTLEGKTIKLKVESNTLDSLVTKAANLKKNLEEFSKQDISLDVKIASNIADLRKSIKDKLSSIQIDTELADPVNVDDFIRGVGKKVKEQVEKSYVGGGVPIATKLALPGIADPLKALQKNLNQKDPLRAKISTTPSILKADVTAFKTAVSEKFKDITVKVKAELGDVSKQSFATGQTGAAGLFEYMRSQGLSGGNMPQATEVGRSERLKKALEDLTVKQLQALAKEQGIGGVSRLKKDPLIAKLVTELNQDIAENILGNIKNQLRDVGKIPLKGVLDTFARGLFNMLGMDPASMRQQMAQQMVQQRALPGVNFPATVPSRAISIGPSSTGRSLPAGRAAAGMIGAAQSPIGLLPSMSGRSQTQAIVEALIAQQGPKMLPSGGGALVDTKRIYAELQKNLDNALRRMFTVLEVSVSETGAGLKDGLNTFAYLAQALKDAEARTKQSRIAEEVDSLINRIETALRLAAARVNVRQVQIGIGASMQSALPAARVAGLLPAGVGREPSRYATGGESREQMMARRTAEAYARSALRGMDVMGGGSGRPPSPYSYAYRSARPTSAIVPYATGGSIVPSPVAADSGAMPPGRGSGGGLGGFGGMGGLGGFGRAMGGINLPGAGAIRELGDEFGFATKQVLLFGQAYKLLGFLQSFPGQVGAAVGQLQTFRNTLGAISPNAQEVAASNQLILDLVEKYNVPLQSARDGFTKLYASMAPAGFSGDEIRNLFTGITQAAATFGMSADKVDRVNYAFAQMASKGQVMSEELKGQLGDVLPGAMSIFAKAAGFEGPKAIQDFSAALEAGSYKGEAMVALLKNVGVVMKQEFGPGAEGAALTFQGVINRMQNSMTLLYESFEPVAVGFLNTIVVPLTSGIKQISDGFNAFFTGTTATTTGGGVFAQQLQSMLPAIKGIKDNITGLIPVFRQFGAIAGQVAQFLLQIAGNPVIGYLAKLYLVALPLNIAFNALTSVIRSVIGSMTTLNVGLLAGSQRFTTYRILMDATGLSAAKLTGILRGVAPALNLVTVGLRAIAGPVILIGISLLIERFMMLKGAIDGVGQSTKQMLAGISSMANTGAVGALENTAKDLQKQIQTFESLRSFVSGGALGPSKQLTPGAAKTMEELGMGSFVSKTILGKPQINDFINASKIIEARLQGLRKAASGVQEKLPLARRVAASIEAQTKPTETISPIPPGEGDEKGAKKAVNDAEQLAKQQQQRRIEQANFDNDMDKINFDHKMQLSDAAFEHAKQLIDERNQYELSGLNDMQARQVKFAQDLKKIRLNAEDAIRKAIQKTEAAQLNVATAQRTAQAAGAPSMGGQAIFGNTGRTSQAAGWVHGHFQTNTASLATLIGDVVPVVKQLLSQGIPVELSGGQKFNTGMSDADITALLRKGASQHGHSGDGRSIDLFVPKGTAVPSPLSDVRDTGGRGGITGVLPGSGQSWVGHLDPRSKSGAKQSSASFSMDTKMQKESFDLQKQYAQSTNQINLQALEIERAIQLAKEQTATTIKANIDNLFPVEKQKLDLRLQQMRHNLLMQGMPQEYIDYEEKRALATEEAAMASQEMTANIAKAKAELSEYNLQIAKGIQLLPEQKGDMAVLNNQIKANEQGLKDLAKAQQESNIIALESAIATMKQADALKAMEEVSGRINDAVEGVTGTYKSMFKEIAMGGDSVEALKKAQQALADQFLTMVFDMAMKPVEESMKNTLGKMFGVPDEKKEREKTITAMEKQLAELEASKKLQEGIKGDTAAIRNGAGGGATPAPPAPSVPGQTTAASGTYGTQTHPFIKDAGNMYSTLPFNGQTGGMLQTLPFNGQTSSMYQNVPSSGGAGFLSSIGIDSEALSASITDSANAYSDQLGKIDTSVFESATALGTAGTELGKEGAAGKKWHESLGQAVGGLGMAAGAVMGIVAGINQIKEGGTSNVLGGIGMIASMAGSLLGSFGGLFGGGGGASSIVQGVDMPVSQMPAGMAFANGGIAPGGFRAFANGGTVSGPTLGLVGEGKYNEAVVPLPDGKSIPVQLGGGSSRDLLGGKAKQQAASPILSMNFQSTTINGVEYVDRAQLEAAMAETRKMAARDGAAQGSQLALSKLKNSPNTRRQLGMS